MKANNILDFSAATFMFEFPSRKHSVNSQHLSCEYLSFVVQMDKTTVTRCDLCHFKINTHTEAAGSDTLDQFPTNLEEQFEGNDFSTAKALQTIFTCFSSSSTESTLNSNPKRRSDENNFLKFCSTCKLILKEWSELENAILRLQLESRKLKSSLTSRILQGMSSIGSTLGDKRPKTESSLIEKINKIQQGLWREYTCQVSLNRMDEISTRKTREKTKIVHEPTVDPEEIEFDNIKTETDYDEYLDDTDGDPVQVDIDVEPFYDDDPNDGGSDYDVQSDPDDPTYNEGETKVTKFTDIECDDDDDEEEIDVQNVPKVTPKTARQIRSGKRTSIKKVEFDQTKIIPTAEETLEIDGFEVFFSQGRFHCGECGASRGLKTYMVDHIRKDHADPTKKSKTSGILNLGGGKYLRKKFEIQTISNEGSATDEDEQKFQCVTCGEIAQRLGTLVNHINQIHLKETPLLVPAPRKSCFSSVEIAPNLFEYQGFQFTFDPSTSKYSCSHCKCSSVRRRELHFHMRKVHIYPGTYKPKKRYVYTKQYMCDTCGKIFCTPANLKTHVAGAHDGAKFDCEECGKSFKWNASLYVHRQTVHGWSVSKKHEDKIQEASCSCICSYCGKNFANSFRLKKHEQDMHQKTVFNCLKCQLTFGSKNELTRHWKRIHRVKKPSSRSSGRKTGSNTRSREGEQDSEGSEESAEMREASEEVPAGQCWGHFVQ